MKTPITPTPTDLDKLKDDIAVEVSIVFKHAKLGTDYTINCTNTIASMAENYARALIQDDIVNQLFRDGAELHITKPGYAYVQLGSMRYYFIGTPKYKTVSTPSGDYEQEILPYDGWEKNL